MKLYMNGQVISLGKTYILFETNNIGHIVYVANPSNFNSKNNIKLFVYEYESEYQKNIYGFQHFNERILFEDLISVSGVGPKTALITLTDGYQKTATYIANNNALGISKFKHMGEKTATQICLELSAKYRKIIGVKKGEVIPSEISTTLKTLGFNDNQITYAIKNLKPSKNVDDLIEKAISLIANEKQPSTN